MDRTTNVALNNTVLRDNQRTLARLGTYQEQLSSGKRINRVSDDPVQARTALRYRAESVQIDKYIDNIAKGGAFMDAADSAFSEMGKVLDEAKKLAVQGANASQDASSRKALATSVDSLLSRLVDLANTVHDGRYIFAGTDTLTQPFNRSADGASVEYDGNLDSFSVQVGPASTVVVNQDGHTLFQGAVDVFKTLGEMRDALAANDGQEVATLVADVDTASSHVNDLQGAMGGRQKRLELANNQLASAKTNLSELISKAEDVDYTKTISDFQMAQTALQAGLQAGAKVIRPTLLDYL